MFQDILHSNNYISDDDDNLFMCHLIHSKRCTESSNGCQVPFCERHLW